MWVSPLCLCKLWSLLPYTLYYKRALAEKARFFNRNFIFLKIFPGEERYNRQDGKEAGTLMQTNIWSR